MYKLILGLLIFVTTSASAELAVVESNSDIKGITLTSFNYQVSTFTLNKQRQLAVKPCKKAAEGVGNSLSMLSADILLLNSEKFSEDTASKLTAMKVINAISDEAKERSQFLSFEIKEFPPVGDFVTLVCKVKLGN